MDAIAVRCGAGGRNGVSACVRGALVFGRVWSGFVGVVRERVDGAAVVFVFCVGFFSEVVAFVAVRPARAVFLFLLAARFAAGTA